MPLQPDSPVLHQILKALWKKERSTSEIVTITGSTPGYVRSVVRRFATDGLAEVSRSQGRTNWWILTEAGREYFAPYMR
jgi:DNA-binding MarR family transcriptional regulator